MFNSVKKPTYIVKYVSILLTEILLQIYLFYMNYTYLKLEDKPVLKFNIDQRVYEIQNSALLPFSLRNNIVDTRSLTNKSEHEKFNILFHNQESLAYFFYNRSLSVKRENAKYIMNQLHIKQNNDFETRYKAMILCKALSVSDSYWLT